MGRRKQYNREIVIQKAMDLFWETGFVGTSMSVLVEKTNLNKRSMYDEFGDKGGLFVEAIRLYCQNVEMTLDTLSKASPSKNFFDLFFELQSTITKDKGCLACNTLAEFNAIPSLAQQRVKQFFNRLEQTFDIALTESTPHADKRLQAVNVKQLVLMAIGNAMYNHISDTSTESLTAC